LALKLYIAYGTETDQVIALRLQALAAVNGLDVYVPPAHTRRPASAGDNLRSLIELEQSDVIIGVVTTAMSEACRLELSTAKQRNKKTILVAEPRLASWLQPYFPELVVIDPADPAAAERAIVEFLRKSKMEENAKKALIALATLALGLLLFAPQE
jgi:hypothetical protein